MSREALDLILSSAVHAEWAMEHPIDADKVDAEADGHRRPLPSSKYARGLVKLAREVGPLPPAVDPLSFWRSQGLWMSWGFGNGTFTPAQLASYAKAHGYEWVAVEDIAANRSRAKEIRAAFTAAGIKLVTWRWSTTFADSVKAITLFQPDAHAENVEHFDWEPGLPTKLRQAYPTLPLGLITNLSGVGATRDGTYDPAVSKPWIEAKFALLPESYMVNEQGAQPSLSPQNLTWTAESHLKWPAGSVFPVFALYRTKPEYFGLWRNVWPTRKPGVAFYAEERAAYPAHSFYVAENIFA